MKNMVKPKRKGHAFAHCLKHMLPATMLFLCSATAVYAADPLEAINGLSDFVFAAIRAIGVILLGWGVVQIGMSLQSHDPSQRTNGFLTFFGGLVIAFAKEILVMIGVA